MTDLEVYCEEYLLAQHSTLWGRAWDIFETESREQAAKWLACQVRGLREVMVQHDDARG